MDGENHGKAYEKLHDFGGIYPYFWKHKNMFTPFMIHLMINEWKLEIFMDQFV